MAPTKTVISLDEFKSRFHIKVNEQQETAMCRVDGPSLLLAVPGSGKTTVIVSRTGYMLYCCGISPDSILNLTYSVAAATEMKERFNKVFGKEFEPSFATIHSFCLKVIHYCKQNWGIYVPQLEPNNERVIRTALRKITSAFPSKNTVREIQSALTLVKNRMMSQTEAERETADLSCATSLGITFMDIYKAYEQVKIDENLMDFDDQLTMAHELLTEYPDTLEFFQDRYIYISIDEAQDTSKIQHQIARALASKNRNLFMVGDDDQSIYRFRGAAPEYLLEFETLYPAAKIMYMDINYRSDKNIIERADRFIQNNKTRFPKHIQANSENEGRIDFIEAADMAVQYERLYRVLKEDAKKKNWTTAVLYRNNDSVLPLLDIILRDRDPLGIRCRIEPEVYFTSPLVENLLTILRFALYGSQDDFMQIYYRLGLYLKKSTAIEVIREASCSDRPIIDVVEEYLSPISRNHFEDVKHAFFRAQYAPAESTITLLVDVLDYDDQVKSESEFSKQKLDILKNLAKPYSTAKDFLAGVETWKELDGNRFYTKGSNIVFSTLHSSKGLEFDRVIMMDITGVILPSKNSYKDGYGLEYEEEVRLFYVGVTRAKHHLSFLTYPSVFGQKSSISRFITQFMEDPSTRLSSAAVAAAATASISSAAFSKYAKKAPSADPKVKEGCLVNHTVFGKGMVTAVANGIITVSFESSGVKKLMLDVCLKNGSLSTA